MDFVKLFKDLELDKKFAVQTVASYIIEKCLDKLSDKFDKYKEKKKLENALKEIIAKYYQEKFYNSDLESEFDFEKVTNYFISNIDRIVNIFYSENQNKELNELLESAVTRGDIKYRKNGTETNQGIIDYYKTIISFIEDYICKNIPDEVKWLNSKTIKKLKELKRDIIENSNKNKVEIIAHDDENTEKIIQVFEKIKCPEPAITLKNQNIFPTSQHYINRENIIFKIENAFKENNIVYVYGMGGIGKSEISREFAQKSNYKIKHFTTYSGGLKTTIALLKFLNYTDKNSMEENYNEKLNLLYNEKNTLLIIDNFDETEENVIKENTPILNELKNIGIKILITTREKKELNNYIEAEKLSKEELKTLFFSIYPYKQDDSERIALVEEIIKLSFEHTMTVDLIAHQSKELYISLQEYVNQLKNNSLIDNENNVEVISTKDGKEQYKYIKEHIFNLFNFAKLNEKQKYIMVNMCLAPLNGIDKNMFLDFISTDNTLKRDYINIVNRLVRLAWINENTTGYEENRVTKISLHPIIYEVSLKELKPKFTKYKCAIFCSNIYNKIEGTETNYKSAEPYIDFIKSTAETFSKIKSPFNDSEVALLSNIAKYFNGYGMYYLSFKYLKKIIEVLPINHPDLAPSYNNIGAIYRNLGNYKQALDNYLKALDIIKNTFPNNHPDLASSYNNIGVIYDNLGDNKKALEYKLKALKIREKTLPVNYLDLASSYNSIGATYSYLGDYKRALNYKLKSLEFREKTLQPNHPYFAQSYNNIGVSYNDLGYYEKALDYNLKALEILKKTFPDKHPFLATSYDNIGGNYDNLGNYKKALDYFLKALEIRKNTLHNKHPDLAISYDNIANTYNNLDDYKNALYYHLKAINIFKITLPDNHPDLAISYDNIANTYNNLDDHKNALYYHLKAIDIFKKTLPDNHPDLASSYDNIGITYGVFNNYEKALKYHLKALDTFKKTLPDNHPDLASSYNNIGATYFDLGDNEKALNYYIKSLKIRKKVLPNTHQNLKLIYENIIEFYTKTGDVKNAEKYKKEMDEFCK